jgi:hypothetical protein
MMFVLFLKKVQIMGKTGKKGWFGNVGYYGVLALSLWAVGASADVEVVTSTKCWGSFVSVPGGSGVIATCPSGYVMTGSTTGGHVNSTNNPTSSWIVCGEDSACGTDTCLSIMAFCAKVCQ